MLDVLFHGFKTPRDALNGVRPVPIRPIDVARATATTHDAVDLPPARRAARFGAIVTELLAHLDVAPGDRHHPPRLQVLGMQGLEWSARNELTHRLGVGFARTVAEHAIGLVDLHSLDTLSREGAAPRIVNIDGTRRQPDFAGADVGGTWHLLEAKGSSQRGSVVHVRRKAYAQVRAIDLVDLLGRPIPIGTRVGSVAHLRQGDSIMVYFEDPEEDETGRTYAFSPDAMVLGYYRLVRDLREVSVEAWADLPGVRGFAAVPLTEGVTLGVHRALLDELDDPTALRAVRRAFRPDLVASRNGIVESGDTTVSVGLDGLALAVSGRSLPALATGAPGPVVA